MQITTFVFRLRQETGAHWHAYGRVFSSWRSVWPKPEKGKRGDTSAIWVGEDVTGELIRQQEQAQAISESATTARREHS